MPQIAVIFQKKVNIVRLVFCLFHYFPFGGLQRDFLKIVQTCLAAGYDIDVYTQAWQGQKPSHPQLTVHELPGKGWQHYQRNADFIRQVQAQLKNQPKAYVIGFNRMPGLELYYAADTCFADKLATKTFFYRYLPRYHAYLRAEQAVFSPDSKTHVLFLCEKQQAIYQHYYSLTPERYTILPPGIQHFPLDNHQKTTAHKQIREKLDLKPNDFLLLMVGSSFDTKGVDRSIRALAHTHQQQHETHLAIVGQGKSEKYQHLAKQLGVDAYCHFLGARNDVPLYLAAADVLLHPARTENTGTVILEALSAGLPVLATENCGFAVHIKQAQAGDVINMPFQQAAMNEQLLVLLEKNKLQLLGENALDYAEKTDLYSMLSTTLELIKGAAN